MQYIYNVSQLPYGEVPEGSIYYNRITREIVSNSRNGTKKFKAIKTPYPVNAFSINGYYPLYATAALAESKSPLGTISQFDLTELGEAPLGINYPVFMPKGLDISYLGNYINPLGDHDDDKTINFRDPQLVGIESLPLLDYRRIDPFQKPDGTYFSVKNYIARPDRGTYNNTDNPVAVATKYSGIVVDSDNNVTWVQGPGGCIIPPGGIFFKNINFLTLPLDSAGYNGTDPYSIADGVAPTEIYSDAYTSPGGQEVDIGAYLDNGHSGYVNKSASDLFVETINAGIIVGSNGAVSYFMPGRVKVAPGAAWFIDVKNIHSPFDSINIPYNGVDPFTPFASCDVNVHEYIEYIPYLEHLSGHKKNPIDEGYINNTGSTVQVQVPGKALIINPSCSISPHDAGELSLPNGCVLICESSLGLLRAIQKDTLEVDLPPEPDISSIQGIQWWRETSDGNLELLPDYITTYEPAVSYWEDVDEFSITPRENPYVRYDESFQYFELDGSLNIRPFGEVELPIFTLQLFSDPANTASLSGGGSYEFGSYIDISCEPFPGYSFVNWTGGGSHVFDEGSKNTIVQVNENISLTANMESAKLSLIIDRYSNGSKSGAGGTTTGSANDIDYGTFQPITAAAATGYNFTNWETDDTAYTSVINISLTSDTTISGYVVENLQNGESGEDIDILIEPGDTLVFTNNTGGHPLAIEDSSSTLLASESSAVTTYQFNTAGTYNYYCTAHPSTMRGTINVQPSIADINSNSTTVRMTEDRLINANFDLIEYNITASPDNYLYNGVNEVAGTAIVNTTAPYKHFDFVSISASATQVSKYEFSFWTSEAQSTNHYFTEVNNSIISINGSNNESLSFKAGDIQVFDWSNTVDQDYPDGRPLKFSTTMGGSNSSGNQYFKSVYIDTANYTTTITTHADTPSLYYYIDDLVSTGGLASTITPSIPGIDSIYNANTTINSISSSLALRAVFKLKEYNVITELVGGQGSIEGLTQDVGSTPTTFSGSFPLGSTIQLAASADTSNGYEFHEWGGDRTSSNSTLPLVVNEDINLTIEFKLKTYTLTVVVDNDSRDDETNTNDPKWSDESSAAVWVVTPVAVPQVSAPSNYTFTFDHGTNVVLQPQLRSDYGVLSWTGSGISSSGDDLDLIITSNLSATLKVGGYPKAFISYDRLHAYFGDTFDILDSSKGGSAYDVDQDYSMASSSFSLDAFNQSKGSLDTSSNTYINFTDSSYIELTNGVNYSVAGGLGDHQGDWAICFTLGAIARKSNPCIFSRGNFSVLHEGGASTNDLMQQGVIAYLDGSRIGGGNAWTSARSGSTIIYRFSGNRFDYFVDGVKKLNNASFSNAWGGDPSTPIMLNVPFVIGANAPGVSSSNGFNGAIRNVVLLEGAAVSSLGDSISEYHTHREDPSQLSWYSDILDWLPLGDNTYPSVEGKKNIVSGSLIDGNPNDFITNPQAITLNPAIEGGLTEDSIEIGLEITDQQGLSVSKKQTVEFGLKSYLVNISIEEFNYKGTLETPGSSNHNASTTQFNDVHIYATVDSIYSDKYEFSHWDGPDASLLDDSTRVDTFIPSISQDINITAVYKLKQYTLTVESELNSTNTKAITHFGTNLSVSGTTTVDYGTTTLPVSYSFTSGSEAYLFDGWTSASDVQDSTAASTDLAIEVVSNLTVTANFSLAVTELKLTTLAEGQSLLAHQTQGVLDIDGTGDTTNQASYRENEVPLLAADGHVPSGHGYIVAGEYDSFEDVGISATANAGYGFVEWIEPEGQNLVANRTEPNTTVDMFGNVEVGARFELLPISTFLTEGDFYFGETIEFTDISTAPSGDGVVVSSIYTNDQGLSFGSTDTGLRQFNQHFSTASQIKVTTPFDYMDYSKAWVIMVKAKNVTGPGAIYSHRGLNSIWTPSQTSNQSFYCYRDGSPVYQTQNFNGPWDDWIIQCSGSQLTFWGKKADGTVKKMGPGGSTASIASPNSSDPLILLNGEIGVGHSNPGRCYQGVVRDIGFMQSTLTQEQVDEFFEQELPDLSYYGSLHDHIACGSNTYPNLDGEKGNISAVLERGFETQFKSLASLTLPDGSPGDTTGSLDVTLTVTDDQGLTDTETQTITYGTAPIDAGEVTYSQFITTVGGLNLLANTSILSVGIEVTDGTITTEEDYL